MRRSDVMHRIPLILRRRREALRWALGQELMLLDRNLSLHQVGDEGDAALDTCEGEVTSRLAQNESRELIQTDRALQRLRDGQYGICEQCGRKISVDRLVAIPYTTRCIRCQRDTEYVRRFPTNRLARASWSTRPTDSLGNNSTKGHARAGKAIN
jgi:DnaK suppressor protein